MKLLSGETLLYPIIGDPIKFVKSPERLTAKFRERNYSAACVPMQVRDEDLQRFVDGIGLVANVRGLLITMPHKQSMLAHCATVSETSKLMGAVSVARRNADGYWHGDMLDGLSFVTAIEQRGAQLKRARVLLVGAGGAGSAIAHALLDVGIRELVLHDANQARCDALVKLLAELNRGLVTAGQPIPTGFEIVVNASPMGMSAVDPSPIPKNLLTSSMFVGDVVAGHGVTPLLQAAQSVGCKTANGVEMVEAGIILMADFFMGK